jgi:hypothetical protein
MITFLKVEIVNLVYVVLEGHYKWYQSWVSFSRVYGLAYIISCIILFVVNIFELSRKHSSLCVFMSEL